LREAIILAGGKAERLGAAAEGRPKPLIEVGGRPLAAYQIAALVEAGVERVLVSSAAGQGALFREELGALGPEIVPVEEPEPLGRGGGLRFAAARREEDGPVLALNGDELLDVDLVMLQQAHDRSGAAATVTVAPLRSAFGIVETEGELVTGFREAPQLPYWVNCGLYVLGAEAIERLPERGDHERSTFPQLAARRRLHAFFHEGVWLTVNTPKELRVAEEFVTANPRWAGRR
jgi:NDP-sugar pyrophosphorylase family protein